MYGQDPESSRLGYEEWENGILKRGAALPHLRSATLDKLVERIRNIPEQDPNAHDHVALVSTHATFWHRKTLLPGLDFTRLTELDPTCFITIVDDVIDVWRALVTTGQSRWAELSPVDILEWREIETFVTEQMAHFSGQKNKPRPFFVIARRYGAQMLQRILADRDLRRYYRSYPITFVGKRPEVKQEADRLAERLLDTAVVFDPMGILDWDRQEELRIEYATWCKNKGYHEPGADWEDIKKHLQQQTVSRDHRLIDQSHGVVVFYPELPYYTKRDGDYELTPLVPFSSGVLDEMQYATQTGKEILLVWTSEKHPGPFLPNIYTHKFGSPDELLAFVNERRKPSPAQ
jgi:hypothetical protein